jgi:Flp pilus assembly protein TadG
MHLPEAHRRTNRRDGQRGTAMMEMALILPIYFLLVYGVILICYVLFGYCNATYASRIAARYGAVHGTGSTYQCTSTDLQNLAKQFLWGAPANGTTITPSWSPDNNPGSSVTVTIKLVYPTAIPFSSIRQVTVGTSAQEVILQ